MGLTWEFLQEMENKLRRENNKLLEMDKVLLETPTLTSIQLIVLVPLICEERVDGGDGAICLRGLA